MLARTRLSAPSSQAHSVFPVTGLRLSLRGATLTESSGRDGRHETAGGPAEKDGNHFCTRSGMPRRPTSDDAVRAARYFLESFIKRTDSQDHILPKNDEFSPFSGFCRVFPQVLDPQSRSCTLKCASLSGGHSTTKGLPSVLYDRSRRE